MERQASNCCSKSGRNRDDGDFWGVESDVKKGYGKWDQGGMMQDGAFG